MYDTNITVHTHVNKGAQIENGVWVHLHNVPVPLSLELGDHYSFHQLNYSSDTCCSSIHPCGNVIGKYGLLNESLHLSANVGV